MLLFVSNLGHRLSYGKVGYNFVIIIIPNNNITYIADRYFQVLTLCMLHIFLTMRTDVYQKLQINSCD